MPDSASTRGTPRSVERRLRADRRARWIVAAGGLAIVACVLGILLFLVFEAAPLARGARVAPVDDASLPFDTGAVLTDELGSHVVAAGTNGDVIARRLADGEVRARGRLVPEGAPPLVALVSDSYAGFVAGAGPDGRVHVQAVTWRSVHEGPRRTVEPVLGEPASFALDPQGRLLRAFAASRDAEGQLAAAGQTADGVLVVARRTVEHNELSGEEVFDEWRASVPVAATLHILCLDRAQQSVYGVSTTGRIHRWRVTGSGLEDPVIVAGPRAEVTAMRFLLGGQSLVIGCADGTLSQWSPVRDAGILAPTRLREFPRLDGAVVALAMSGRSKAFAASTVRGTVALLFGTTGELRWSHTMPAADVRAITLGPRGDSLLVAGAKRVTGFRVDDAHPEATLHSLFLPVWYENYDAPSLTWQSTPATDGGEPKLSLTPLLWGTLKATLFCLLFSVPIAVLAALYVSQFVHQRMRGLLKPAVELMAALPSVVLGFVAAVWLAPKLEHALSGLFLAVVAAPLVAAAGGAAFRRLPSGWRARTAAGSELLPIAVLVAGTVAVSFAVAPTIERLVLGSEFPDWVRRTLGLEFDQKNAVVVAMAMAIAVIPIVFSIAEEAFSNVPRSLVSASLALGADRWQTAVQVVAPAASAGVFSGVMVGFGRAIGETMIVLMAVGATPIIDANPFTGFRTLSANVAIEIPEAPHGGTLYRVLFFAALLLLVLTFVVNTVAELIRTRLRSRHAAV